MTRTPEDNILLGNNMARGFSEKKLLSAVDLFSGSGGLSYGFSRAGIVANTAVDNWSDALTTYEKNHSGTEVIDADLGEAKTQQLLTQLSDSDVVFGGPPCQGLSIAGKRDPSDPRNRLYRGFYSVVAEMRPRLFLMENVPNLAAMSGGELINEIEKDFSNLGYTLSRRILLASDYGVPQNRKRLFLVGTLSDLAFSWPQKTTPDSHNKVSTHQAIGDLPEHSLEDGSAYPSSIESVYQKLMRKDSHVVTNHQASKHEEKTIRIIDMVPDGGNYKNLPEEFKNTRKVNIAWTRFSSSLPSATIDTGHRHHFHYKYNRVPTVRESARLQSFPDIFNFYGSKTSQYRQVGNAVPPLLAQQLGIAIESFLRKN